MPHNGLKRFGMGGHVHRIHCGNEHTGVRDSGRESTVSSDNTYDFAADLPRQSQRRNKIGADLFFEVPAADGKHEDRVVCAELTDTEPVLENTGPAFVICARGQFGNVIGRGVSLNTGNFAEIVDGVRSIGGAATNAEDKKPAFPLSGCVENGDGAVDSRSIQAI
jgi:hypothetical protein